MSGCSSPYFDQRIAQVLSQWAAQGTLRTALDVGAGQGKWGGIIRRVSPNVELEALEPWRESASRLERDEAYTRVIHRDAEALFEAWALSSKWDLVMIGDCIEHMRKSFGMDLLECLQYRSRRIVVVWPVKYLQGPEGGNVQEAHISSWSMKDFVRLGATACEQIKFMRWTIIPGFVGDPEAVGEI